VAARDDRAVHVARLGHASTHSTTIEIDCPAFHPPLSRMRRR
jgi:hypothetical protein